MRRREFIWGSARRRGRWRRSRGSGRCRPSVGSTPASTTNKIISLHFIGAWRRPVLSRVAMWPSSTAGRSARDRVRRSPPIWFTGRSPLCGRHNPPFADCQECDADHPHRLFLTRDDPPEVGLVPSFNRPAGNVNSPRRGPANFIWKAATSDPLA
jgi:hypothetical protein